MKRIIFGVKRVLAFLLFLLFAFISFDWIFIKGVSLAMDHHHSGLFFQEVWSITQNIFTWTDDEIVRAIMRVLAIGVTAFIPVFLSCLFCFYYLWCDFQIRCIDNKEL